MAVGTNTASSTSVVATTGPVTCCIALIVASLAGSRSSCMMRMVFSTTTMASSTTMPMASTRPKSDSVLIDNPSDSITANVPISATGMVAAGIRVVRKSCKKTQTVSTTSTTAMNSVWTTSWIDAFTNIVVSYTILYSTPSGKTALSRSISARTPSATCKALAPGN